MWQRFTERARRVVFYAQEEAGRFGENYLSTEHLLLGIVRDSDCRAARILDQMGVSLQRIRSEIERQLTVGDARLGQDMQLTPRAKRAIDLAYDESRKLSNNYIGTEHLLLGLIREGEGLAGRVLTKLNVKLDEVRKLNMAFKQSDPQQTTEISEELQRQRQAREEQQTKEASKEALRKIIAEDAAGWRKRSLITLWDVTPAQIRTLLEVAAEMKKHDLARESSLYWSYPRTLAMLFEKPSLRTRVSFEVSMAHLEGHAIYLAPDDVGLGTREAVPEVAGALSRWVDAITARVFKHETVEQLAEHATIPVINALSDREHPVQAFADLLTLQERKGPLGNERRLAYVGDGNNVLHALLLACAKTGVNLTAACPDGYGPDAVYVEEAQRIAQETGARIAILEDPIEAVSDSEAVYTDVWTSMGQESEKEVRTQLFAPYQINAELMRKAAADTIVMHCLPAHRGEEISDEMMEAHKTTILDQAENRLHTQKALLVLILGL